MAYCMNCGYKIENEELICVSCGTNMGKIIRANGITSESGSYGVAVKNIVDTVKKILTGMLKAPVTSISQFAQELNLRWTLLLTALVSILFGLAGAWSYQLAFDRILKFGENMTKVNISTGRSNTNTDQIFRQMSQSFTSIKMPYSKALFVYTVVFLLALAITFAVFYIIARNIFKCRVKAPALLNVVVCASIPFVASIYAQMLLAYLSFAFSFVALTIGMTISLVCLFYGIKESLELSANRAALMLPCAYIAMGLVIYYYFGKLITGYFTDVNIKRFMLIIVNYLSGGVMYYY